MAFTQMFDYTILIWILVPCLLPLLVLILFAVLLSPSQLNSLYSLVRTLIDLRMSLRSMKSQKQFSVADMFESRCDENPNKVQFITAEDGNEISAEIFLYVRIFSFSLISAVLNVSQAGATRWETLTR